MFCKEKERIMRKSRILRTVLLALIMLMAVPGTSVYAKTLSGTFTDSTGTREVIGNWKKKSNTKIFFKTASGKLKRGWLKLPTGTYYIRKNG